MIARLGTIMKSKEIGVEFLVVKISDSETQCLHWKMGEGWVGSCHHSV